MQTEFTIEWEDELNKFSCDINGVIRCSPFLRDLLDDIAKAFGYEYAYMFLDSHFKACLEEDLGITIKLDFDY